MENKEIKLGDLRIARRDEGIDIYKDFYNSDGLQKSAAYNTADIIHINNESLVIFKSWLAGMKSGVEFTPNSAVYYKLSDSYWEKRLTNNSKESSTDYTFQKKDKIDFQDRPYLEKRRILRQLACKDELRNFLDIVTDAIYDNLKTQFITLMKPDGYPIIENHSLYNYIKTFLIDGYLAFEIIFDKKHENILGLNPLDPVSLDACGDSWIQYSDRPEMKRVLTKHQVIYMSYGKFNDSKTSYIEELKESYEKFKMIESQLLFPQNQPVPSMESVKYLNDKLESFSKTKSEKDLALFSRRIFGIFMNDMYYILTRIRSEMNTKKTLKNDPTWTVVEEDIR
jgi:hypothetical protein